MIVAGVVIARLSADRLASLGYRGRVRCPRCGREDTVDVFAALRSADPGWGECCGVTRELVREERPWQR